MRWFAATAVSLTVVGAAWLAYGPRERVAGEYRTSLAGRTPGQRHNAALCARRLDGATIQPGEIFSFNERVGSWSADRGYRKAPVSYNGQLVDSWGGGVCQLSTTFYNAALLAGLDVLERHPHRFAPSYVEPGRDAAVAFRNVDLRVVNPYKFALRVEANVVGQELCVALKGLGRPDKPRVRVEIESRREPGRVVLGHGPSGRVRNSGRAGFEVTVWREWPGRRELLSRDSYPAIQRIVERN